MFKDLFSLHGRVALITGGSRGIGKMIAAGFLAQGAAKVYITARKAGPCEATAKELTAAYNGECIALPIDISTVEGCNKLAAEFIKLEPKLDILVNNAGAAWGARVRRISGKRLGQGHGPQRQVAVLPDQGAGEAAARGGLATSGPPRSSTSPRSTASSSIHGETYSYGASKAAVIHLTRRMATKLIKDNINVTAIAPGAFASDMNRAARDQARRARPAHSVETHRDRRGYGGHCHLPRLARRRLRGRQHHRGRRRRGVRESRAGDFGVGVARLVSSEGEYRAISIPRAIRYSPTHRTVSRSSRTRNRRAYCRCRLSAARSSWRRHRLRSRLHQRGDEVTSVQLFSLIMNAPSRAAAVTSMASRSASPARRLRNVLVFQNEWSACNHRNQQLR